MKPDQQIESYFERYLSGKCSLEDEEAFELLLLQDESLLNRFTAFKDLYVLSSLSGVPASDAQMSVARKICDTHLRK